MHQQETQEIQSSDAPAVLSHSNGLGYTQSPVGIICNTLKSTTIDTLKQAISDLDNYIVNIMPTTLKGGVFNRQNALLNFISDLKRLDSNRQVEILNTLDIYPYLHPATKGNDAVSSDYEELTNLLKS